MTLPHPLLILALPLVLGLPVDNSRAGQFLDKVLRPACRSEPICVIRDNPGGDVSLFQQAAQEVLAEGKRLVIDGKCDSACVILADIARANTCLTPRAEMEVHEASETKIIGQAFVGGRSVPVRKVIARRDPPQSADITVWVQANGGYPVDGFMEIPIEVAVAFWPMCDVVPYRPD